MDVIVIKNTFANGDPVEASEKPQSFDDKTAIALIAASKAIPVPDKPEPKPKKKKAKKD
jgi:hypothetical protein|tara:strand:- start:992 stop:1168 length:177 start_codon:yes stop_codon:yes gene_type:complete